jgi:hypothetical protein
MGEFLSLKQWVKLEKIIVPKVKLTKILSFFCEVQNKWDEVLQYKQMRISVNVKIYFFTYNKPYDIGFFRPIYK